jgi:hypothetical protein
MNPLFRPTEAIRIAETYLPLSSNLAVNLPGNLRDAILQRSQSKDAGPDLFDAAARCVFEFMRNDTFLKWRVTPSFAVAWHCAGISDDVVLNHRMPGGRLTDDTVSRLVTTLAPSAEATVEGGDDVAAFTVALSS